MYNNQSNGHKRRLDYANGRTKRSLDDQDFQRKRRRNSSENKSQELPKKQRRDRAGYSDDHSIDNKYPEWHDKDGHFNYRLGESLGDQLDSEKPERRRYKLIDKLGQGTFGLVLLAWDRIENCYVAVKIVRAIKKYTESALTEIEILTKIQRSGMEVLEESLEQISVSGENSSKNISTRTLKKLAKKNIPKHCCITLESWFQYKEHICMVFQKYGLSLYDYLKQNQFKGLEYSMTKDIAFNLFASLYYLHEGLELIHTDLKPENILFVDDGLGSQFSGNKSPDSRNQPLPSSEIKIIDLGSATFEYEHHSTTISTRHYRAPEVYLQIGWSFPSDVWSIGCILLELFTGKTYFQTHDGSEHLAMMETLLGPFPSGWLLSHKHSKNNVFKYFETSDRESKKLVLRWQHDASSDSKKRVRAMKSLKEIIPSDEHRDLLDLITKSLMYDPKKRITAAEALDHCFFDSVRDKYRDQEESRLFKLKRSYSESSSCREHPEVASSSFMSRSRANSLSVSGSRFGRDSQPSEGFDENVLQKKLDDISELSKNKEPSSLNEVPPSVVQVDNIGKKDSNLVENT